MSNNYISILFLPFLILLFLASIQTGFAIDLIEQIESDLEAVANSTHTANLGEERLGLFPDVPTLKEAIGSDWTVGARRLVAGPKGLPQEVIDVIEIGGQEGIRKSQIKEIHGSQGFWHGLSKRQ